ncbi:acyl carrier protein [Micromonospora sp. NPDC050417]|uniref:acyl carrier protein n=1 Tax=Micromonospora sp. NPDC050417 TaxID=3364280 RepID=UPI003792DD8D
MQRTDIDDAVRNTVAKILNIEAGGFEMSDGFKQDLQADSLDIAELAEVVCNTFQIQVAEADIFQAATPSGLSEFIHNRLMQRQTP